MMMVVTKLGVANLHGRQIHSLSLLMEVLDLGMLEKKEKTCMHSTRKAT